LASSVVGTESPTAAGASESGILVDSSFASVVSAMLRLGYELGEVR
jgi:hypothetical protein